MFRRSCGVSGVAVISAALATAIGLPASANPVVSVRIGNASSAFDLAYAASASSLGGFVTAENAPLAAIPRQSSDAYAVTSASPRAIAGALIYRAAGEPTRECTFRYTLTYTGARYVVAVDARASWTGQVRCTASASALERTKGDFTVTFTMQ
ncbi:MAG TPA: hypothetical protein VGX96_06775 [Candidatus Elarobacter sp.]|nr:hypothetical protein [Candidatus Elarobacter sp.]